MARPEDARSPSPTGSSYSYSSKRSRRTEDRHDRTYRDEGRGHHRRRSRSRSPDVREKRTDDATAKRSNADYQSRRHRERDRDRDYHRRDRSIDRGYGDRRRDEDHHHSSRRDRSRDRRRSRERDDRRRSRERAPRRDDSRNRGGRRRDGSADSKKRRREDSREAVTRRESVPVSREASKASTPAEAPAEDEKAAKLAKIEEWKRKRAAKEQTKKKQESIQGPTRSILNEMDRKAGLSPTSVASPMSPATPEPATTPTAVPYAGKFDPKAIAKKSHSGASTAKVLGSDIAAPANGITKVIASSKSTRHSSPLSGPALKPKGNLSGFGLNVKSNTDQDVARKGLAFDDDEQVKKKLEKLPSLPAMTVNDVSTEETGDTADQNDNDDDDGDIDMHNDDNEEEALAAARAAVEQRRQAESSEDVVMTEAASADVDMTEIEDDEDPLDAFMSDLTTQPARQTNFRARTNPVAKGVQQEPEAMFGDDEVDITAVEEDNPDNILSMANATAKKKKKDIPTVNHDKVQYQNFRRNFYSEPIELSDLSEDEVASLRMELDNIKVRGVEVPKPVRTWAQCGLGVQVLEVIQKLGYEAPTSIQSQAVPAIMSGRDVIGVAKTGSGKTIAFLLPMFRHIKDQPPLESLDGPVGLILSPTRELATQIHKECRPFVKAVGLRAVCAYGGAPIKDQIAEFKRGAEIVVCTPGRMIDLLAANGGRVTNLRRITYVVLDEADRMFDMGFEPQVMKILANIRPDRQTVLFSATFPRQMEALARKTLSRPVEIIVGGRSVVAPEITQIVEVRSEDTKFVRLLELLGLRYEHDRNEDDRTLIFVDRQEAADGLLRDLMKRGYPCLSIHGGKDQVDRDSAIQDFKNGIIPILIATSVAARGLDVKQLKLVVNYDAPNHLEDYVHRAGRTGRAGNTGTAVTFITPEQDRYSIDISKALKQSGQTVPEDVAKLVESFQEKVKAGKEKAGAGGFGGKGLERLDQERDAAKARERKSYKTGDENEEAEDKEESKDAKVGDDIFAKAASSIGARDAPNAAATAAATTSSSTTPAAAATAAESSEPRLIGVPKGIDLDGKIIVHRTERASTDTKNSGAGANSQKSQMDRVAAAVAGINQKLSKAGVMRSGVPIDNKGPDAGAFHATLEINDFPQKARWAVTNRTNVAKILESTGTSITTKGSFYAAGKEPQAGENAKLYILVEGDTEVVVQDAMRELMRLLKEGTMSAAESSDRGAGRYSVV